MLQIFFVQIFLPLCPYLRKKYLPAAPVFSSLSLSLSLSRSFFYLSFSPHTPLTLDAHAFSHPTSCLCQCVYDSDIFFFSFFSSHTFEKVILEAEKDVPAPLFS
jgi:hypothetical protein